MMTKRTTPPSRPNLFTDTVKLISECIDHLHDDDLSQEEQNSRELLFDYYRLLMKRWKNPRYGKPRGGKL